MTFFNCTLLALCLSILQATAVPNAKADEWDKATKVTFSTPVELPGIVLTPGTYWFKLADSLSDRNIVQVFSEDRAKLFTTILAIPDYRLEPKGKTVMSFEERAAGAPEALKAWFYPGDLYGFEFVYPKARAVELAQANKQHVPAMPSQTKATAAELKRAPVTAVQTTGREVPLAEVHPSQAASEKKPAPGHQVAAVLPQKLPKTASPMPLIGLIGLIAFAGSAALRYLSKRVESAFRE